MFNFKSIILTMAALALIPNAESKDNKGLMTQKPNIIYILADDLGYGDLGSFGQQKIQTPNLDAMAANGLKFTQHYAGSTVCAPSRASLMTGKSTAFNQIRGNFELGGYRDEEEYGQLPLEPNTSTLAKMLHQAGYKTGAIGKWGLGGPNSTGVPTKQGFDYFFGYLDQKQAHNYYPTHLWRNNKRVELNNDFFIAHHSLNGTSSEAKDYKLYMGNDYAPDMILDEALEFISSSSKEKSPFFLYLAFVTPHAALQLPDERIPTYTKKWPEPAMENNNYTPHPRPRAVRAAMISNMDKAIGQIMEQVNSLNDKNTLVIFTSDNGPSPEGGADTAFFNSSGPLRGGKQDLYEGGIRVPMIAHWPGKIAKGKTTEHVSAFWDVMPTFADLVNTTSPQSEGISFLPTLLGEEQSQPKHESLYWEFKINRHNATAGQAVRIGNFKTVCYYTVKGFSCELYDLSKDISENNDIAAKYPQHVERAKEVMKKRSKSKIEKWNF